MTTTMLNGWHRGLTVLAHDDGRGAVTYANLTQARKAAALIPGAWVVGYRPFYVAVPAEGGAL